MIEINETTVLDAMSVVPIAWLRSQDIAGEMGIEADGRKIVPILKRLLAKGVIQQSRTGKLTEWRLTDEQADKAIRSFEALTPPHSWYGRKIPEWT